ncbi:hypothetical protein RvY_19277, partial [Ramazzottius varieornatus]
MCVKLHQSLASFPLQQHKSWFVRSVRGISISSNHSTRRSRIRRVNNSIKKILLFQRAISPHPNLFISLRALCKLPGILRPRPISTANQFQSPRRGVRPFP